MNGKTIPVLLSNTIIETKRLILRELLSEDLDDFFELDSNPMVHQYLGNHPVTDKSKIKDMIEYVQGQYAKNGFGRWAVIDKKSSKFIGWAGLKLVTEMMNDHINFVDFGYRFRQEFWNQGFATESAVASLEYGFNALKVQTIYAATHVQNGASNHILSKIGFKAIDTFDYHGEPQNWYFIHQKDWLTKT